jgi:hypothetical protein
MDVFLSAPAKPPWHGFATDFVDEKKNARPTLAVDPTLIVWWRIRDSNTGPADYDSVALTG